MNAWLLEQLWFRLSDNFWILLLWKEKNYRVEVESLIATSGTSSRPRNPRLTEGVNLDEEEAVSAITVVEPCHVLRRLHLGETGSAPLRPANWIFGNVCRAARLQSSRSLATYVLVLNVVTHQWWNGEDKSEEFLRLDRTIDYWSVEFHLEEREKGWEMKMEFKREDMKREVFSSFAENWNWNYKSYWFFWV